MPEVKLFRKPYDTQIHAIIKIPGKDEYVFMKPYDKQEQTPIIRQDRGLQLLNTYYGYDSQMFET